MDQDLQDLKNLKLIELEEKLHEINNNNKVSFNEYECESIDSPIEKKPKKIRKSHSKKIVLSDEEVQEEKMEKPKRERSEKQKLAFEKARLKMMENAERRKKEKESENEIKKKERIRREGS